MFLPFEGLYAEVVNHGLVEILQNEYKINIAGRQLWRLCSILFRWASRHLLFKKEAARYGRFLVQVKTEFTTFEKVLNSAKDRIRKVDEDLDKLVGVRTRQINRKLRDVESLDTDMSIKLIDTEE